MLVRVEHEEMGGGGGGGKRGKEGETTIKASLK